MVDKTMMIQPTRKIRKLLDVIVIYIDNTVLKQSVFDACNIFRCISFNRIKMHFIATMQSIKEYAKFAFTLTFLTVTSPFFNFE